MEQFIVEFMVLASGYKSFKSKDGREFQRASLMGMVSDAFGNTQGATASLGYGADFKEADLPKKGDTVLLSVSSIDLKNALCEIEFIGCELKPKK